MFVKVRVTHNEREGYVLSNVWNSKKYDNLRVYDGQSLNKEIGQFKKIDLELVVEELGSTK